ncbi:MAG: PAS domain S-box protein [Aureliella sp.]
MDSPYAFTYADRISFWQRALESLSVDGSALAIFVRDGNSLRVAACAPRQFINKSHCIAPEDVLGADCVVANLCMPGGEVLGYIGACWVGEEPASIALAETLHRAANYIEIDIAVCSAGQEAGDHEQSCVVDQLCSDSEGLKQSQRHLKAVLDSIGDAVIVTDNNATITQINPVASTLTGWSAVDAVGCSLGRVLRSRNVNGSESDLGGSAGLVGVQDSPVALDLYLHARNGAVRRISCTAAPIRRESQICDGMVLVFRDTTQEHAVQKKLRQSERLQSIGQLAGGIAHEFNNMLGAIQASGECLQMVLEHNNDASQECVEVILDAARKAAQLTGQLLAFARRGQLAAVPIELHTMMNSTLELMSRTVDRRIVLSRTLDATRTVVNGDRSALQGMLLNTAVNASHALKDGGTIAVSTRNVQLSAEECLSSSFDMLPGEYCEISVRDDGQGIQPQDLEKVFDPFYTTKSPGGSGLGLSAAYGTVQDHGGSIEVKSTVGKGTTIRILLPITSEAARREVRKISVSSDTGPKPATATAGRVLIVDDEASVRASARLVLTSLGYDVIEAANGLDALAAYEEKHAAIDVVLLDINMPGMNGLEVYHRLQDLEPSVRVVVASGFIDDRYRKAFGDCKMINKPYSIADLTSAIKAVALQPVA